MPSAGEISAARPGSRRGPGRSRSRGGRGRRRGGPGLPPPAGAGELDAVELVDVDDGVAVIPARRPTTSRPGTASIASRRACRASTGADGTEPSCALAVAVASAARIRATLGRRANTATRDPPGSPGRRRQRSWRWAASSSPPSAAAVIPASTPASARVTTHESVAVGA